VAPEYRRQGLAEKLMGLLEETTVKRCVLCQKTRVVVGGDSRPVCLTLLLLHCLLRARQA
jgi:hypothetical protein